MPPVPSLWSYNYETLAALSGLSVNSVQQHKTRGSFDPNDLRSVILWLARNGPDDLRQDILAYALERRPSTKPPELTKKSRKTTAKKKT